jgi:hypothetical protein
VNILACLVHERPECVRDLVANLPKAMTRGRPHHVAVSVR